MKISTIKELLDAEVICNEDMLSHDVYSACGSDMMSDVLAYVKNQAVLLTGLVNSQVIRTAEMMDMVCIVFVRSKRPTPEYRQDGTGFKVVIWRKSKNVDDPQTKGIEQEIIHVYYKIEL